MMEKPKKYSYTNEDGEEWEFEYNPETGLGTIRGSEFNWYSYVVAGGVASLILDKEERKWLMDSWIDAKKEADQKILSPEMRQRIVDKIAEQIDRMNDHAGKTTYDGLDIPSSRMVSITQAELSFDKVIDFIRCEL